MPFWLLNFEEIVEVLIGDNNRKAEIEVLQELIPIAKSRYNSGRTAESTKLRRGLLDTGRYTVDTPVPYRISDLTALIDERMGKLENKRDLAPYRQLKNCIDTISQDGRYGFMFGSLTVYDGMTQVLGRIFRVPVNDKPITILELTGLPTGDRQRRRLGAVPHDVRFRAVERGPGARDAGLRGSPSLRSRELLRSASSRANARSPRSPRKAANTAHRCAS